MIENEKRKKEMIENEKRKKEMIENGKRKRKMRKIKVARFLLAQRLF